MVADFECLESQIRLIQLDFGSLDDTERLLNGANRIQSVMNINYDADDLCALAYVARRFGEKAEDRALNIYIHTWIKLYLEDFMVGFVPTDSTEEKRAAEGLKGAMVTAYLEPMAWLDKELLLENVVALGRGMVEAMVLEKAAVCIGEGYDVSDREIDYIGRQCKMAVRNGYAYEVAEGRYDDMNKLRALLCLARRFVLIPDYDKLEEFEEQAKVVRGLIKPAPERDLHRDGEERGLSESKRWYRALQAFCEACHHLAAITVSEDMYRDVDCLHNQSALPYLNLAALCFGHITGSNVRFFGMPGAQRKDEDCSETADKIQVLALFALDEKNPCIYLRSYGRFDLMRLAREIGVTIFHPPFQQVMINQMADRSPDYLQSLREQGRRLLNIAQDDTRRMYSYLVKLVGSSRAEHERIVDEARDEIDARGSVTESYKSEDFLTPEIVQVKPQVS